MNYNYYYNRAPGSQPTRNNLVYTSLMSEDLRTFVQWFYNDTDYHRDQNEIIDPCLMEEKWEREVKYITYMSDNYPEFVPTIIDIDYRNRKLYLEVDGLDFWNCAQCNVDNYIKVLPDWQEQILKIITAHRDLGLYKYSMHPSSYFVVNGQLKSINYFFCYHETEGPISIADHASHIYSDRQLVMREQVEKLGLNWDKPEPLNLLQQLCFESFRTNYPETFIELAKRIYN